jgi:hypothetical protein
MFGGLAHNLVGPRADTAAERREEARIRSEINFMDPPPEASREAALDPSKMLIGRIYG